MKRLNGWMRLGVITSVVWMVDGAITVGDEYLQTGGDRSADPVDSDLSQQHACWVGR
jgi:hypothetical protein